MSTATPAPAPLVNPSIPSVAGRLMAEVNKFEEAIRAEFHNVNDIAPHRVTMFEQRLNDENNHIFDVIKTELSRATTAIQAKAKEILGHFEPVESTPNPSDHPTPARKHETEAQITSPEPPAKERYTYSPFDKEDEKPHEQQLHDKPHDKAHEDKPHDKTREEKLHDQAREEKLHDKHNEKEDHSKDKKHNK
jgi:hypothetical protein